MDTIESIKNSIFNSIGLKLALIGFLSLVLIIPASMIGGLIREREQRRNETIHEVTSVWGNEQTITGPILTIAYRSAESAADNTGTTRYIHILPENLNVGGTVDPELRYRGIYGVVTYRARLVISGKFQPADLSALQIPKDAMIESSWIEIGIPDMRGINKNIQIQWGDSILNVIPGIPGRQISSSGVHAKLVNSTIDSGTSFNFSLDLNGSTNLNFIPVGKETNVSLSSTWKIPSFQGAFLPDSRKIDKSGFSANWQILQLNRNYPQQWIDDQYPVGESSFGVSLMTPVDNYQKSQRSVKYALLFIGLTFLIFFFAEVMTRIRIHPVYYLLVGVALCVFYSLLTALSEYLDFRLSYLIAGTVIVLIIAVFTQSLYRKRLITTTVTSVLVALYLFLFVILQLADYSLLFGNIGLVIILTLVMYFSRKIDWYSPFKAIQ